jgi:MFS family permease
MSSENSDETSTCDVIKEEIVHLKWRVLIVACFLTFGSYYIYDFPGAIGTGKRNTIEKRFAEHGKEYNQEMNQALYSVYSWPNTVLAIFGGLLIDKYLGLRRAMLLFTALVFTGSLLFWIGVQTVNFPLMLTARVIFGLGGESLSVAQSAFVARWFKGGRGLALAFGITISFSRVGSSFNFLFSPEIAKAHGVNTAVLFGMFACLISFLSCFVLIACDVYAVNKGIIKASTHEENAEKPFKLADLKLLPKELWAICTICVFCYTAIFPFIGIAKNFFEVKFNLEGEEASRYISLYQFTSAGASPVIGALVDSVGRNTLWLIAASSCFILIHFLFLVTSIPPPVMMPAMGLFYSFLVSGLWPSVPWVVPENVVGFSYGVMTALQNAGLAIFPLMTGAVLDAFTDKKSNSTNSTPVPHGIRQFIQLDNGSSSSSSGSLPELKGFKYTEILFMASAGISLLASIVLFLFDIRGSGVLTSPASERRRRDEERRAEQQKLINEDEATQQSLRTQDKY